LKQATLLFVLAIELKAPASSSAAAMDRTITQLEVPQRRRPEIGAAARERALIEFANPAPNGLINFAYISLLSR
jgi:hypothetical protein